jgi:hypothetical protein
MSQQQCEINIIDSIRRFLWPIGIFRDASKGNPLERAAAYRHNREARGCLPHYMSNYLREYWGQSIVSANIRRICDLTSINFYIMKNIILSNFSPSFHYGILGSEHSFREY